MADFSIHTMTNYAVPAPYYVTWSTNFASNPGWHAFRVTDGSQFWLGSNGGTDWLAVFIGSGAQLLTSYSVQVNTIPQATRAPKNWTLEGSPDGSSWTTLDTETNQTSWSSGEIRSFTISSPATAYSHYRINVTANNGDATYTQIAGLYLFSTSKIPYPDAAPHNMTSDPAPFPYVAAANSEVAEPAFHAFDGVLLGASSWVGSTGGVGWLSIDLGAGSTYSVNSYTVGGSLNGANRSPKTWTFEGSNDNSTWTVFDTQASQTSWDASNPDQRSFLLSAPSAACRYFRLNITANNGDATNTDVLEMYIWQAGFVPGPPAWGITTMPNGTVGVSYTVAWDMPSSALTVAYSILSGSLPGGLSVSALTGNQAQISGTPTTPGTFNFTLRATNAYGTADQPFTIVISAVAASSSVFGFVF